jgi:hypothetical protein
VGSKLFKDNTKKFGKKKHEKFDQDIESLHSSEDSSWQHGFNTGCLAMARLSMGLAAITRPCVLEDEDMDCCLDVDSDTDGEPLEEPGPCIDLCGEPT